MAGDIQLEILGTATVMSGGKPVHLSPKERSVLAGLALAHPAEVTVHRLIDYVWGEAAPSTARKAVQTYIASLRRHFGDAIYTNGNAYGLGPSTQLDQVSFIEKADAAERSIATDPMDALGSAAAALSLVRGRPFDDLPACPEADSARVMIADRVAHLQELCAEALVRTGRANEAVTALEAMVSESPYRERAWWLLMLSLHRAGRRAEGLRSFVRVRTILGEDIGIEPGEDLCRLEAAILADSPLLADEAIFGRGDLLRARLSGNLHRPGNSFVGRDDEMHRLIALLEAATPVVCVAGAAGVGKSRLTLEAARRVTDSFPDGSWLVPLAGVSAGGDVLPTVLDVLGIGVAVGSSPMETFTRWCAEHRALVVLDTCEHVLDSVPDLVAATTRGGSATSIVLTTRSTTGLQDYHVLRVGPLPVPPLGDVPSPASTLFLDRMGVTSVPEDTLAAVGRICRHLEGLPLAIELAAARSVSVSPVELERHLDQFDRFLGAPRTTSGRHASLEETLTWSTELLDERSARLFDRLSVFPGGCSLSAAQEVCGFGILDEWDVLDGLHRLVSDNLLKTGVDAEGATRYRMLDTIRRFAGDRLASEGEAPQVQARLREHLCRLGKAAMVGCRGPDEAHWVGTVRDELPNIRAVHEGLVGAGDVAGQAQLLAPLINFAVVQAFDEVLSMAERTMSMLGEQRPPGSDRILAMSAWGASRRQDHQRAAVLAGQAVAAAEEAGDASALSEALQVAATAAYFEGDLVAGRALNEQGARLARSVSDRHGEALNLGLEVMLHSLAGRFGWHETADRVLDLAKEIGSPSMLCWGYYTWGISRQIDDPALALAWYDRAVYQADAVDASFYGDLVRRSTVQVLSSLDPARALRVAVRTMRSQLESGELFQVGLSIPWFVTLLARMDHCEAAIVFEEATYRLGDRVTAAYLPEERRKALEHCYATLEPEPLETARLTGRTIDLPGLVDYAGRILADLEA